MRMGRALGPLLVITFATGVAATRLWTGPPTTAPTMTAAPLSQGSSMSIAEIARNVSPAVVSLRTDQQIGSGMIYDPSGLILTNAHVVHGAHDITVTLSDGRHFAGTVVGADSAFDIAVIGIAGGFNLPTVPLGSAPRMRL